MEDKKQLNLYQRMLLVSSEVMNVEKNTTVSAGTKSSYKAVADYDVVVAVKKAEAKHGVISVPVSQELIKTEILTTTNDAGYQRSQFVDIVKVTMHIFNADDPSDSIKVEAYGRGIDGGDKGFGKASTYARKYCLLNAYKIATGEDPDKDASVDARYSSNTPMPSKDARMMAIEELNASTTGEQLTAVWNKWKDTPYGASTLGKDETFKTAVKLHPANPKH